MAVELTDLSVDLDTEKRHHPNLSAWGTFKFSIKYLLASTWRDLGGWGIGILTVFLVVMFISLLQNNIEKSPLVFMKLSENSVGEIDLLMTPRPTNLTPTFFLNQTLIQERVHAGANLCKGTCPRWYMLGEVANRDFPDQKTSAIFMVLETETEEQLGLGRAWGHRILGEGETHVSAAVLRQIGVRPNRGERVTLSIDFLGLAETFGVLPAGTNLTNLLNFGGVTFPNNVTVDLTGVNNSTALGLLLQTLGFNVSSLPPGTLDALLAALPPNVNLDPNALATLLGLNQAITITNQSLSFSAEYAVVDSIDKPNGKYPTALGNVALIEARFVQKLLVQQIQALIANPLVAQLVPSAFGQNLSDFNTLLDNFRIQDYALTICAMYTNREEAYLTTGDDLNKYMIEFSNNVMEAVGYNTSLTVTLPVSAGLSGTSFIRLFLDQIFNAVIFVLILLGSMLIFSLLLSDVEEKTYEYGMLRALGMRHNALIELLINQAIMFAVPGIALGLFISWLINVPIAVEIANFAAVSPSYSFAGVAIGTGFAIGILMPLLSNYVPIQRALSKTLRDALDIYHQVVSETTVRIIRLESLGLSPWQTSLSVILVVIGFVTYYMIPYAFTYQNFSLFLTILNGILLGMVLGLAMISQVLQPYLERLALWAMLWGKNKRLGSLVRKNLAGHRRRNRKTALMFTISLAFLIFAGALFTLQTKLITDTVSLLFGADIVVIAPRWDSALDETSMRAFLETEISRPDTNLTGYTFITFALSDLEGVRQTRLSNLGSFPSASLEYYGLEQNYLHATYTKFYIPTELDSSFSYIDAPGTTEKDAINSLYVNAGEARLPIEGSGIVVPPVLGTSPEALDANRPNLKATNMAEAYVDYVDVIISEGLRDRMSVDVHTPTFLRVDVTTVEERQQSFFYLCKARAMVRKMPGFFFSSYRQFSGGSPILVTMENYMKVFNDVVNVTADYVDKAPPTVPPKQNLLVSVKAGTSIESREGIMNGLRNFIKDDTTTVVDVPDLLDSTKVATDLIVIFFNIVAFIASILSFFVLFLSFTANVRENQWEFGVLRAIGLGANQVLKVYVFEALALILSSVLLGTVIGLATAITLTLQMGLFTESPFQFDFPFTLFFSVLAMSLIVAVVGSWLPARKVMKRQVAIVLKG